MPIDCILSFYYALWFIMSTETCMFLGHNENLFVGKLD